MHNNFPAGRTAHGASRRRKKTYPARDSENIFCARHWTGREAVRRTVVVTARFAVVHAERQKQRRAELVQIIPLREILPPGLVARGVFVGHEEIAEINVKIRRVGADVCERLLINFRAGVFIQMHVRRHGEGERAARCARGMKLKRGNNGIRRGTTLAAKLGVILRVRQQFVEREQRRFAARQINAGCLICERIATRSVNNVARHHAMRLHAHGDGAVFRPRENDVQVMRRNGYVEIIRAGRRAMIVIALRLLALRERRNAADDQSAGGCQKVTHGEIWV